MISTWNQLEVVEEGKEGVIGYFWKILDASCSQDMSDKNVILVLKYCIFDRTIFGAIKCKVTYA